MTDHLVPLDHVDPFDDETLHHPYPPNQRLRHLGPVVWLAQHDLYPIVSESLAQLWMVAAADDMCWRRAGPGSGVGGAAGARSQGCRGLGSSAGPRSSAARMGT
jgi:hypothetical protein